MYNNPIIVGLDIGTTKICAIVGQKNSNGKIEILGMGKTESLGVMRGVVANIEKTVNSIKEAVKIAEAKSNADIGLVYVGIAGQHIKSIQHRGMITRSSLNDEISNDDIDAIIKDMHRLAVPPGQAIIHVIPQEYIIDNEQGIKDPVGMSGIRLEANCHIITGLITAANNINKCVQKAGLEAANLILEPLASAEAVLSEEEKEAGVVLVDIGGGTTDIAIFQDGIIRHTAVIPFGGNVITDDIKEGCSIIRSLDVLLKVKFGSALAKQTKSNEIVSIPGLRGREPKEISVRSLAEIIQARMEEIIECVAYEIKSSGFEKKLIAGIVVTGGGSQLKNIAQLIEFHTGMDTRIGYPNEHLAKGTDEIKSPMYATAVGLVLKGIAEQEKIQLREPIQAEPQAIPTIEEKKKEPAHGSWFNIVFQKGKDLINDGGQDPKL
ncbi:MAG: cell division protein FtsA [Bacteroidota bacterium]